MKLAFSTLGCPELNWAETCAMAKDIGFAAFEVRDLGSETFNYHAFRQENRERTIAQLTRQGIAISCFSSGTALRDPTLADRAKREIREYVDLASAMGTRFVRVLADDYAAPTHDVDDAAVFRALSELAPYAESKNVVLLVETNGVYSDTARLRDLLTSVRSDSVGALWDIHHPYRFNAESPECTVQNLGALIKYTHFKDSVVADDGEILYKLPGEGDLPISDAVKALNSIDFNGFISLEWLKRYAPDLESSGVVFPHFVNFMSQFSGVDSVSTRLYDNLRKTGKYLWQKERLIDLTFPQLLDRVVEEFPDQLAFDYSDALTQQTAETYHRTEYTRTYAEFREDVDTFARSLIALGVKQGDKVAIWSPNIPEWFITFWASVKIGAVLVTVNTAYKIYEAEYLLRQSDTHTLVMSNGVKDSDYVAIVKELIPELAEHDKNKPLYAKRLPFLRNVITCESTQPGCRNWTDALNLAPTVEPEHVLSRANRISKDDVCNMQYTSGTTGFPKGVMLTHYNVVNNAKAIGDCMDLSTADRMMIQVPMFHCFGMVLAMTASVTHGSTMSPIPTFSPKLGLACINAKRITAFHGVPTMFIAMLEHPDFSSTDFSSIRTGIMAGSPCPVEKMREVIEKMNMTEICITYGQTEASPATSMSKTTDSVEQRVNTVGGAIFGVECKIFSPERNPVTGKYEELPDDTDGEFVARGYNIMRGYYKMPEATAAAIDEDGWLHTGDMALKRGSDGYFKITGRIKDMIIRGGENIYPKEIEDFIYTHPSVSDVQIVGVPDEQYGEEIMACVVAKKGETLTEDIVKDYVRTHMAKHKTPRYVRFVDSFPMNAAGKILKYKMREDAIEYLNLQTAAEIETA
ncbi:MAG: AMP-binding protein [Oscillospiraceae bacterium]|jgi:fatty-acyl-CoA synthase|nr:AMP-binding protein [Oscillospiraceae bacterium]